MYEDSIIVENRIERALWWTNVNGSTGVGSEMIRFSFLLSPLFIIGSICFRQRYIIFSIPPNDRVLFPAEVGGYFSPLACLPFDDGITEVVGVQPLLCPCNDLVEFFCFWCALQFGLAFAFVHPQDSIVGVAVDRLVVESLLPAECKGMDDG